MPMNLEIISKIRSKLKSILKNKEILDVILFGSIVKGKSLPNDIDIAIITEKKKLDLLKLDLDIFHVSILSPRDFFINPPIIINTLLREGFSIKKNKSFSESYNFSSRILFKYDLSNINLSTKVKIVNNLRGKGKEKGLVLECNGEWIANQVFTVPVDKLELFERFFLNFKIKFNKYYVLMH